MQRRVHDIFRSNAQHAWPTRADDRIEPECWPALKPRFKLTPGCTIFTIGSCFARNIETHLARLGFDVPVVTFVKQNAELLGKRGADILNKYTPPTIYQELAWTKAIMDRDDQVTEADIEPFLLETKSGLVLDLLRRTLPTTGIDRATALKERQALYRLFRNAFTCDALVMTLGLIESWYDNASKQYIEFYPDIFKHKDQHRFAFKRLDYVESYDYTRRTIELINGASEKKILLTTSPVPLSHTFTADDIIVANNYSKSVLRAVSGKITEDFANVDYFPSYESVMLTKQPYVWRNDLRHVDASFVARIMARVSEAYLPEAGTASLPSRNDDLLRFAGLVRSGDLDGANELFRRFHLADFDDAPAESVTSAAELALRNGDLAAARQFADKAAVSASNARLIELLLRCASVYAQLGDPADEEKCLDRAFAIYPDFGRAVRIVLDQGLWSIKNTPTLLRYALDKGCANVNFLTFAALTFENLNQSDDAQRAFDLIVKSDDVPLLGQCVDQLLRGNKVHRALPVLQHLLSIDPSGADPIVPWARRYWKACQFNEAAAIARLLYRHGGATHQAATILVKSLIELKKFEEAAQIAEQAVQKNPENPEIKALRNRARRARHLRGAAAPT